MTDRSTPWLAPRVAGVLVAATAFALAVTARAQGDHARTAEPYQVLQVNADSVRYSVRVTNNNQVGMTLSNYGFFGNNFVSRSPSLEYPFASGYEHMVRGGLWIGARALSDTGYFTTVVTGAVDGSQGTSAQASTEFTPAGLDIVPRSKLKRSPFYDPHAVSELDMIGTFSDIPAKRASGTGEDHRPMSVLVRQESYCWSFAELQNFVIVRFIIKSITAPIKDMWVGFYSEFASGNKNAYSIWPPSSAGGPGSWYNKKWIAYDDSIHLVREHFCNGAPAPDFCQMATAPYWIGAKLLGTKPESLATKLVTATAWGYAPGSTLRDQDTERYAIMSTGVTDPALNDGSLLPPQDPVTLLCVGPFAELDPGDSIEVAFAIVGGASDDASDIQTFSAAAQRAFDNDYIVPVPPPSPAMKVVAHERALDVYWEDSPESFVDDTSLDSTDFEGYRLYVGESRGTMKLVKEWDKVDGRFFDTGLQGVRLPQPVVIDGVTYQYKYTVTGLRDGFKDFVAVTAFDEGTAKTASLESGVTQNELIAIPSAAPGEVSGGVTVFPNPYRVEAAWDQGRFVRDHYIWFANLPQQCTLRIYTLGGDLIFETDFDGATYAGQGARGIYDPAQEKDVAPPTLSGGMYGWNLISREGQAVATGLYLYSVEDHHGGKRQVGKFLLVKSDRE